MKVDQVNGGIEGSSADDNPEKFVDNSCTSNGSELQAYKKMRPKQGLVGISEKRKTGKSDHSSRVPDKNPIQISRQRSAELTKNLKEQCKELSISADGIKKSPIQIARQRSDLGKNLDEQCKELSVCADGIKKIPIQTSKARSELWTRSFSQKGPSDGMERSPIQLRKGKSESNKSDGNETNAELRRVKSDAGKALGESVNGRERNSIELMKAKEVSDKVFDESSGNLTSSDDTRKIVDGSAEGIKKNPAGITEVGFDKNCKDLGVKSPPKLEVTDDEDDWDEELEEGVDEEIEIDTEKKSSDVKEIRIPEHKAKKIVVEEKKIHQTNVKPVPISTIVRKRLPSVVNLPRIIPKPTKTKPNPSAEKLDEVTETNSKLQSLVDLVMWQDMSKSAFIFGLGTFIIVSSSYTTDLNISLISIISYLGLVYLGAIFLIRSILFRGAMDVDDTNQEHVVGEEEAIWLVKLVLPYVNEFLLKLRALFSGDPATTMKLAVLLFVLARCGSSITVWKMGKLGKFWIRRSGEAWESCSHKKAVGFFTFTILWNLSSVVARIWAVFMLAVAFRYYQYSLVREERIEEEATQAGSSSVQQKQTYLQGNSIIGVGVGGHTTRRRGRAPSPTSLEINKQQKKAS